METVAAPPYPRASAFHALAAGLYTFEIYYDVTVTSPVFMKTKFMNQRSLEFFNGSALYKCMFLTTWCAVRM